MVDDTVQIQIKRGATVTFGTRDPNDEIIANYQKHAVPGVPPYPMLFNGQFVQLDVVTVSPAQ